MNPRKIIHLVLSLDCGGLENLVIQLCAHLNKNGYSSSIACLGSPGNLADQAHALNIEVIDLKKNNGLDLSLFVRLAGLLKRGKYDIVHTHNPAPLIYGSVAGKLAGTPAIINTRHGRLAKPCSRVIWSFNDAIVAISNDARTELLKCNKLSADDVSVIHNGIDLGLKGKETDPARKRQELGIAPDSFVIGTVGRLSWEKDQKALLHALAGISKEVRTAELCLVGDGPLREELVRMVSDLGIAAKVRFLGFRKDIHELMPVFDVFVLPSLSEGISLTLLEAMAASKPIVATRVGGNPEVVIDGVTGLIVPSQDQEALIRAVITLAENPGMREKMGKLGRTRVVEEFSIEKMSSGYNELYRRVLAKKGLA